MWVRAQVDHLQRLPNDLEKQKALERLPPTLPDTYIRIFEIIDSMYPFQTTEYVQRLLEWLVHGIYDYLKPYYTVLIVPHLTTDLLCKAVCLENEGDLPLDAAVPTSEQIFRWLGCLIRKSEYGHIISLSHFTVKEFLMMKPEYLSSSKAKKFLVNPTDINYILKICLTYIMHEYFESQICSTTGEIELLLSKHSFLKYAASSLCDYIWASVYEGLNDKTENLLRRFLSIPPHPSFELWDACFTWLGFSQWIFVRASDETRYFFSPLHFAAMTGLLKEVQRLLEYGADPDGASLSIGRGVFLTPLHLAICIGNKYGIEIWPGIAILAINCYEPDGDEKKGFREEQSLGVIRALIDSGIDIDRQLVVDLHDNADDFAFVVEATVTPLVLAIICRCWRAASILLDAGASSNAVAHEDYVSSQSKDFVLDWKFLNEVPVYKDIMQDAIDRSGHQELTKAFEGWKIFGNTENSVSQPADTINDSGSA